MDKLVENKKRQLINLGLMFLLIGTTAYFLLRDNDIPQLFSLIESVNTDYLFLGLGVMVLFFTLEAGCLRTLLKSLDYKVSLFRCLRYSLIDFYFSSITPGCCGGQPSQIYYMKRDRIPLGVSSLVLLLFNLAYHVAVLIIAFASIALGGQDILSKLGYVKYLLFFGIAAQTFLIIAFVAAVFSRRLIPSLVEGFIGILSKTPLIKDQDNALKKARFQTGEYQRGAAYIQKHPGILLRVLLMATLHIAALYSISFWVYKAFGLSGTSLITLIAVQAALTLSVESLPIPGGMGITESSFLFLYGSVFGSSLVLPALLLCRGINYYTFLIAGGIVSAIPFPAPVRRTALFTKASSL